MPLMIPKPFYYTWKTGMFENIAALFETQKLHLTGLHGAGYMNFVCTGQHPGTDIWFIHGIWYVPAAIPTAIA